MRMTIDSSTPQPWLASEAGADVRKYAPATQRNRDAIVAVLTEVLPREGLVLELASGSGEHAVHFASVFPGLTWRPSDPDPHALASIDAWRIHEGVGNVLPPLQIDAAASGWPIDEADAVLCINMIHISPWSATQGLLAGASRLLRPGQPLYVYGPFIQAGVALAPSNAAFDASLRERDPAWGLRSVEDVAALAREHGFGAPGIVEMPANNLSLIFRR
jgi:hypothetical protein